MKKEQLKKILHTVFNLSILTKAFDGLWETTGGVILLFLTKNSLTSFFHSISYNELVEDPRDHLILFVNKNLETFSSSSQQFAGVYMLFHGLMNLFLAIQLYRKKIWAYQFAIILISLFICYQIYRIYLFHSITLIFITLLDIIFVYVTWFEFKNQKLLTK